MEPLKYPSVTTPDVQHDAANMITELILLNKMGYVGPAPWRIEHRLFWGKTVAAIRKLIKQFEIDPDQLAFFVYRCEPTAINAAEFAKAAVVAKKLFQKFDLMGLVEIYKKRFEAAQGDSFDKVVHRPKTNKSKSLIKFLEELKNATP